MGGGGRSGVTSGKGGRSGRRRRFESRAAAHDSGVRVRVRVRVGVGVGVRVRVGAAAHDSGDGLAADRKRENVEGNLAAPNAREGERARVVEPIEKRARDGGAARRVERVVCAAFRCVAHGLGKRLHVPRDHVRRAILTRELEPARVAVDGDDARRARQLGRHDGAEAHGAHAGDDETGGLGVTELG